MRRYVSIDGNYIGNAIGYCHCEAHIGALNREQVYKHKCIGKKCKWLEKWSNDAFRIKKYKNKR